MELSQVERWILSNQLRIMKHLKVPDGDWGEQCRIVEEGFELHYDTITEHIQAPPDVMSIEECREVLDILDMYTELTRAYGAHTDDLRDVDEELVRFPGFDGDSEGKQLGYVDFLIEDWGRFEWLKRDEGFNSQLPKLPDYRRMLGEWKTVGWQERHRLGPDDVRRVLKAGLHRVDRQG